MEFLEKLLPSSMPLSHLPFVLITIIISFTVHEFSHAYMAYRFGDLTAYKEGRVTLNPLAHVEPIGILCFAFLGFGWARPVPVSGLKPKQDFWVTFAGPFSNFLLGCMGGGLFYATLFLLKNVELSDLAVKVIFLFFHYFITYNFYLCFFNLLPIPPLDGFSILRSLGNRSWREKLTQLEPWGLPIFMIFVFVKPIAQIIFWPIHTLTNFFVHLVGGF